MGAVTQSQLKKLGSYRVEDPNPSTGEMGMLCPFHNDHKRSASLNVDKGIMYCHACGITADISQVMAQIDLHPRSNNGRFKPGEIGGRKGPTPLSSASLAGWQSALQANAAALTALQQRRGLDSETIRNFELGWDRDNDAYTIPVYNPEGELINIRRYQLDPKNDRRKIWSVQGHGSPVLYPWDLLADYGKEIILCEGELDAMLTIQNGFEAITRTGSARTWNAEWLPYFKDKVVYVCHDMDRDGQQANEKVAKSLRKVAKDVYIIQLPYPVTPKHGKDLTDYWLDGYTPEDFNKLLSAAVPLKPAPEPETLEIDHVNVIDTFKAADVGRSLAAKVTITGKRSPSYLAPLRFLATCSVDQPKCPACPFRAEEGKLRSSLEPDNPVILKMVGATEQQVFTALREHVGAIKCPVFEVEVEEYQTVEELYIRPSVDRYRKSTEPGDYTTRRILNVGRHDTMPNNTVEITGSIYPHPKTQANEFLVWDVNETDTSLDSFEVTPDAVRLMEMFQPNNRQRPLDKLVHISKDLAHHVTKIYGRNEMHALMDLTMHSVIAFNLGEEEVYRGWLDTLIIGDTRTGKSEAAQRLQSHFGAGEFVSCESATFAGVVGGLQQFGGKEWVVTWGAIPTNDRRAVVLDEVSGLSPEQIAQMSSIRSSGEAQLTKIQSERTYARTRLMWLANPRFGRQMSEFTYGVHAVMPLIGSNEDVARFDIAMSVAKGEVPTKLINSMKEESGRQRYHSEACQTLLRWVWSRKPEQVIWAAGAVELVYQKAIELGATYVETPPLIQAANVRIKVARLAVALAARLFSTDRSHQKVVVRKAHVEDAVRLIHVVYGMRGFGYKQHSEELLADAERARACVDDTREFLGSRTGLAKFLRGMGGTFRRQDLEDMMNYERHGAATVINELYKFRMVRREGADVVITAELQQLLREVDE